MSASATAAPAALPQITFQFSIKDTEQRAKQSALSGPYWVYHIHASTNFDRYPQQRLQPVRRYSDFDWFRQELSRLYPWCIIPPIPEKSMRASIEKVASSAHDRALIDYRMRALRKFLLRVGSHPVLQRAEILQDFLEKTEEQWAARMKAPKQATPLDKLIAAYAKDFGQVIASQWSPQAVADGSGAAAYSKVLTKTELPSNPQVWEETKHYVDQLEDGIKLLKDRIEALLEKRRKAGLALDKFGQSFESVGHVEAKLEQQGDQSLSNAVIAVGRHSKDLATVYNEQADQEGKQLVEILRYYEGLCEAVKEALTRVTAEVNRRDALSQKHRDSAANRDKQIDKGAQGDKVAKLNKEVDDLLQQKEVAEQNAAKMEDYFREELRKFHREKQYDFKSLIKSFVDLQTDYADKMRRSWESLLPTVEEAQVQ